MNHSDFPIGSIVVPSDSAILTLGMVRERGTVRAYGHRNLILVEWNDGTVESVNKAWLRLRYPREEGR